MTVKQLQALLRQRGLPVTGRKAKLVKRLTAKNVSAGPKPKAWQHSQAKKDLKKALLDPKSQVHKMTLEQIRKSDPRYQQYPNFAKYYTDLKSKVEEEKKQVEMDDIAVRMHKMSFPRSPLNKRGYPHWDTHPARGWLEADIANNLHKKMKPLQLMATYKRITQGFSIGCLCQKIF